MQCHLAVQLRKLHKKLRNRELEDNYNLHKWLRELEKYCEYIGNISTSQLRACQKVRHPLTLAHRNRTETNFDDELTAKFAKQKKSFQSACFPRLFKGQARGEIASKSSLLGSFISEMHFHIRSLDNMRFHIRSFDHSSLSGQLSIDLADSISQTKEKESSLTTTSEATLERVPQIQLCRDSFQQLGLQEQWTTNSFQEAAFSSSLSTKALDSNNFQDSSLAEETF